MKYASESLLPQITIRIKMNLSQIRMWFVVTKQIWLGYPIQCYIQMNAFDGEWFYSPTPLLQIVMIVEEYAEIEMQSPHLFPLSHKIQFC